MGTLKSARREEFEAVALPHVEALWRTALWLTMKRTSAEELVVRTMTQAYRTWDDSHDAAGNKAFLFRILVRKFSKIGKRKNRPGGFLFENGNGAPNPRNGGRQSAAGSIDEGELWRLTWIPAPIIRGAIARLRPQSRLIMLLLLRERFSYADIAYITDLPRESIKSILVRLRRLIPRFLADQVDPLAADAKYRVMCLDARILLNQGKPQG